MDDDRRRIGMYVGGRIVAGRDRDVVRRTLKESEVVRMAVIAGVTTRRGQSLQRPMIDTSSCWDMDSLIQGTRPPEPVSGWGDEMECQDIVGGLRDCDNHIVTVWIEVQNCCSIACFVSGFVVCHVAHPPTSTYVS